MRRPSRRRLLALGGLALVSLVAAFWIWGIPALIVAAIRQRHEGHVAFRGWWIDRSSAGVTGLVLRETPAADSPIWATAERATTDLSIGAILRGQFSPRRITFHAPRVHYRIGEDGHPVTRIPVKHPKSKPEPVLIAEEARLTMAQAGRPEMVVHHIGARLDPEGDGARFRASSGDAGWGKPIVVGRFGPGFDSIALRLTAELLPADREKAARIPFVSKKVWDEFRVTGPIRAAIDYTRPGPRPTPGDVEVVVGFERTKLDLPHLDLSADEAEGRLYYHAKMLRLDDLRGAMVGGRVAASGSIDFRRPESRYFLTLDLDGTDLDSFPPSWGLETVGLSGRLTGTAGLRMTLSGRGLDVTGSSGRGTVDEASIRGIPLGRLGLALRGEGLRAGVDAPAGVFLPQWLGTDFEVRDVELDRALARVGTEGGVREVPVSGRLGIRLALRMPLGTLHDLAAYRGEGSADLAGATIGGVRLGRLAGRLGLAGGVLDVSNIRGRLAERPARDEARPAAIGPPPETGPLPAGGFRGRFRADLAAGGGHAEAEFEGERLPLDALAASAHGALSIWATATTREGKACDPRAWSGSGRVAGVEAGYRSARFRDISATLALRGGRLAVSDLAARLDGQPVTGRGEVEMAAPHAFVAWLDGAGLPLGDLLAMASPGVARHEIAGIVAARAEASGTLAPRHLASRGEARIDRAEFDRIPLGDVPLAWETRGDDVVVTAREIQRYGGTLSAEARFPAGFDRPVDGTVTLARVDAGRLSVEVPGSLHLSGLADGEARFRLPLDADDPPAEADVRLAASRMTVEGIPARTLRARVDIRDGAPRFEVEAEGLDGTVFARGSGTSSREPGGGEIDADVKAINLRLAAILGALHAGGPTSRFDGRGSVAARVQIRGTEHATDASGTAEVCEMKWGDGYDLGQVRAGFAVTPDCWRIGDLEGSIWGGPIRGEFWRQRAGGGPERYGVDLRLRHASLARVFAFAPDLGRRFEGFASFRAVGRSEGSLRGRGEILVDRGFINHLPIAELTIPVDWDVRPEENFRGTVQVRKASVRIGGGELRGDAVARLGRRRREIQAQLTLDRFDMRAISRAGARAGRPMPGRIDGVATLESPDLGQSRDYTGKVDLVLTGASLVDIPILDGIDTALGSARGAVFDEGDLHARLARREVRVDRLTLVGPVAQLHASGTIDLDGRLDLRAFINTNDTFGDGGRVALSRLSDAVRVVRAEGKAIDRMDDFLTSRLIKIRIAGTLAHPSYSVDGSIHADEAVLAFLAEAMRSARRGSNR